MKGTRPLNNNEICRVSTYFTTNALKRNRNIVRAVGAIRHDKEKKE